MLMRVRTSIYQICRRPSARRATAAASVCLPPIWYTAGWLYVKNERTTCTKVGMTFSELDVSLKVSHDECFRVKFEQDISWWIFFLSIHLLFFPLLPSFLITFYSDCRHIVWNLQQKPKKTWKSNFFVYLSKEKQRIIIEDWSRVFRLKKNKKQNIFTIIFDYSVLPPFDI